MTSISPLKAASSLKPFLSQMPWHQRLLGKIGSSESHGMFAIDTASNWAPKMLTTRSVAEAVEGSFLEFMESGFFYYLPHNAAQKIAPWFQRAARHLPKEIFTEKLLTKSVEEIRQSHPHLLRQVLPVKAAIILTAVIAAGVAGEYALSFAKNLLTLEAFNKSRFSDIANLTDDHRDRNDPQLKAEIEAQNRQVREKAYKRFKQIGLVAAGLIAGSIALARFGHRLPGSGILLEKLVKALDFKFDNGNFVLERNQTRSLIALGVLGYLDAARDKLELKETATRLLVVAPFLMFGKEFLGKLLLKPISRYYPQLLEKAANGKLNHELGIKELAEQSTVKARELLEKAGGKVTEEAVQQKAKTIFEPLLRGKNAMFLWPFLVGTIAVGIINTKIAQHFTRLRNEREQARRVQRQHQQVTLYGVPTGQRTAARTLPPLQVQRFPAANPLPTYSYPSAQPASPSQSPFQAFTPRPAAFQAFHESLAAANLLSTPSWHTASATPATLTHYSQTTQQTTPSGYQPSPANQQSAAF